MNRLLLWLMVGSLVVWTALFVAGAEAGATPRAPHQIQIGNFTFMPAALTVRAGSTVTWVNQDDVPHTVVSTTKKFSSQVMDTNGTYTQTFTQPGIYEYYCSVHPHMKGKVIVE